MIDQLRRFGAVGVLAAATHYLTALGLMAVGLPPLLANPLAFLVAFQVSYFGHRRYTFDARTLSHRRTLPRFLLIALAGLLANESLLWLCLRYFHLPPGLSLGGIILVVALGTFCLSRAFAFRVDRAP